MGPAAKKTDNKVGDLVFIELHKNKDGESCTEYTGRFVD
jgi:hypothetical protein